MVQFNAVIEAATVGPGAWVTVPVEVVTELGGGGRIPVQARFDNIPYQGSVVSMGESGMVLGVLKDIQKRLGKGVGDEVVVTLERDAGERTVEVPADLAAALAAAKKAAAFAALSYSKRREIVGQITAAKKSETRQRRIEQTIASLG
jgi:hypothetical protein